MELNSDTTKLICTLERIVGDNCYNPKSRNGYTQVEGLKYRYPVCYVDSEGRDRKCWQTIPEIPSDKISSMRYNIGANQLCIGNAIVQVLDYLEKNFNLDFNKLISSK